jgi:hypothetical protein
MLHVTELERGEKLCTLLHEPVREKVYNGHTVQCTVI